MRDRLRKSLQDLQARPNAVAGAGWPPPGRELEVISRIMAARPPEFRSREWIEAWDSSVLREPPRPPGLGADVAEDVSLFQATADVLSAVFTTLRLEGDHPPGRYRRLDWHGITVEAIRTNRPDLRRRLVIEVGNLLEAGGLISVRSTEDLVDGRRLDLARVKQDLSEEAEGCRLLARFLRGLT